MDTLDMARDVAHITGEVLRWARERAGLEPQAFASLLGKGYTAAHILAWELEQSFPTFSQAEKIAEKLRVPFGILFMPSPPDISLPIPDLRTISGKPEARPSLEFLDLINDAILRQHWYREELAYQRVKSLDFVGRFRLRDNINLIAADISKTLGIDNDLRKDCSSWQAFLTTFIQNTEQAGVLVMRSSVVRHATKRKLLVEEFRGFAISDSLAPLVFINTKDAISAQIFTLAHELAHIWLGESGISNADPKRRANDLANDIEKFCNKIAAQLLVPEDNVARIWRSGESADKNLQRIASFHRVSKTVAAIRARDMNRISFEVAAKIIEAENRKFAERKEKTAKKKQGPSFWSIFAPRNSLRLTEAIVTAVRQGRVLYLDAASLLGTKVSTLQNYLSRIGGK